VAVLDKLPTALFQVSLTSANPDDEHTATAQSLVQELPDGTGFDPDLVGLFAGPLVVHAVRLVQTPGDARHLPS